jgi:putative nucleotidyltransferase with HDIG domain
MSRQTIVVLEDEQRMREYLSEVLTHEGYQCESFSDGLSGLRFISENHVDLVLADIGMPKMSGLDLLRTALAIFPNLPIVMISGRSDVSVVTEALRSGAAGYLIKPAIPADISEIVNKYIGRTVRFDRTQVRRALGEFLATWNSEDQPLSALYQLFRELGFNRYETLQHARRVMEYAVLLGAACRLLPAEVGKLRLAALLHDIGKVAVPGRILSKPEQLDDEETRIVRKHARIGWELLSEFPDLSVEADIVYSHHERFDGTGYPRQIAGDAIPLLARILSIVDAFDVMTSTRPFRPASSVGEARQVVLQGGGTQFDPEIVRVFCGLPTESVTWIRDLLPERGERQEADRDVSAIERCRAG